MSLHFNNLTTHISTISWNPYVPYPHALTCKITKVKKGKLLRWGCHTLKIHFKENKIGGTKPVDFIKETYCCNVMLCPAEHLYYTVIGFIGGKHRMLST
jgi:hypothetical protein